MELLENFATIASTWVPTLFVIAVSVVGLGLMRTVLRRSRLGGPGRLGVLSQLSLALLTAAAVIAVILALPIGDTARGQVLDALHGGGIEIVSPTFMNQRQIAADHRFIPKRRWHHPPADEASLPEEKIFDKAEEAESREQHVAELDAVEAQIKKREKELAGATNPLERDDHERARGRPRAAFRAARRSRSRQRYRRIASCAVRMGVSHGDRSKRSEPRA